MPEDKEEKTKKPMNHWIITAIAVIVVGGAAFFGGVKYQQSRTPSFAGRFGSGQGRNFTFNGQGGPNGGQNGANRQAFRPISGKIISKDDKGITVEMQDGSSKIVLISDTSSINKSEQGSTNDLTEGTQVAVFGTENSDGSISAQNIQIGGGFGFNRPQ